MRDLEDLRPKEARELLALAAVTLQARAAQRPTMVLVRLNGPVTDEAMRSAARGRLAERRRTEGSVPVDLSEFRRDL